MEAPHETQSIHQKLQETGEKERCVHLANVFRSRSKAGAMAHRGESLCVAAQAEGAAAQAAVRVRVARRPQGALQRCTPRCFPSLLSPGTFSPSPCNARADVIKTKGKEKIEVDDLVREITPHGRASVPDHVKAELLSKIQHFISVHGS